MITPNLLAYAALLAWPVVVWRLYRRLDAGRALIWSVLGAYLLLPPLTAIDLPVVPPLDKDTLPPLSAALVTAFALRRRPDLLPESRVMRLLVGLFVVAPFFTVLSNPDPLRFFRGPDIPGMRLYDSVAVVATQALYVLPMFLARRDLARPEAMRDLLLALVLGGLAYSLPILLEARLSPQMNLWIYGYYQHDFTQTLRFGGFRPMVFLPHGLWLAMFVFLSLAAAAAFLREGPMEVRPRQLMAFVWLAFVLWLAKSFGAAAYAVGAVPLILFAPARWQILAAAMLGLLVMVYPLLRGAHLVPLEGILDFVRGLSGERAWSLEFRIHNEEALLARAAERPWFGWGGYARQFIHDPFNGHLLTIADGAWIIQIGQYGWLGYVAGFGLLCLPLGLLLREALAPAAEVALPLAAVALAYGCNLADLLPNATLVPLTWLMGGALLGQAERLRAARRQRTLALRVSRAVHGPPRTVI